MNTVSETTQTTLHNLLRVVASGTVIRSQSTEGGWILYINDQIVTDEEIQLAVGVLDAKHLIRWWPDYRQTQRARSPSTEAATAWSPSATGTTTHYSTAGAGCGSNSSTTHATTGTT
jgi:hypothetical protein